MHTNVAWIESGAFSGQVYVYCLISLGIVGIAIQITLHSTHRMCTWARQGRNVWIVGVVGKNRLCL